MQTSDFDDIEDKDMQKKLLEKVYKVLISLIKSISNKDECC